VACLAAVALAAAVPSAAAGAPKTEVHAVTLITGDEVVTASGPAGPRVVDVRPAPGREHVRRSSRCAG
jgi:hypothetical protein